MTKFDIGDFVTLSTPNGKIEKLYVYQITKNESEELYDLILNCGFIDRGVGGKVPLSVKLDNVSAEFLI